jgi:hypothetical protein
MASRPTVNGRSPIGGVLRGVRCHIEVPQLGEKLGHIVRNEFLQLEEELRITIRQNALQY